MNKKEIFVNLKRFEVNRTQGGVCDHQSPEQWIQSVVRDIGEAGLGQQKQFDLTVFVPDALLSSAMSSFHSLPESQRKGLCIGSQGCHHKDVSVDGNFGAFTSLNLAGTQSCMGSSSVLAGHCEERQNLRDIMERYARAASPDTGLKHELADKEINTIIGDKVAVALAKGMNVVLCVGETAEQQGEGSFEEQKPRIEKVLRSQINYALSAIKAPLSEDSLTIAYEPIWAIGPGKTPPGQAYIEFIVSLIKQLSHEVLGFEASVVYGGGLKRENASMLADIPDLDGGLIALTNFSQPIGFNVDELVRILSTYTESLAS